MNTASSSLKSPANDAWNFSHEEEKPILRGQNRRLRAIGREALR